ncbi:hypothetical protein [Ancylobacter terrae]|uniref:hypothetical protein n=1 Tax=Ancylobacter sp. sgz301288 TaxID=3342077 RepID=UPI00385FE139
MEMMFGVGALVLLLALAYGTMRSKVFRRQQGKVLPEERVTEKADRSPDIL